MSMTILIVDDEKNARSNIKKFLEKKGYEALEAEKLAKAKKVIKENGADIVLLDVQLPDGLGTTFLEETARMPSRPPIILITAYGEIDMAVEAMKNGAQDFLQKPVKLDRLEKSIQKAAEVVKLRRELNHLRQAQREQYDFVLGTNSDVNEVYNEAQRAAEVSSSVLITGETGTGKEVLARAIHAGGTRAKNPFIAINCAAIQNTMLEPELFGFEAGAFTSAEKRKSGLMEVADGGILFLDEISSMPVDMQAKILRAIEEQTFRRMGGNNLIQVDIQILAASNRDLKKMIKDGSFRDDLYYRLKVVDLHIPPLRDRKDDIPGLAGFFIRENNPRMGKNVQGITPKAMTALKKHKWPGNIRELRNVIERAMLFCDEAEIDLAHLPKDF
ncbi:MAG: sigma-54 dependent transcriptional regulator [Anaerolineae bacterium]|nr:sigma-54 dependent transcriptional regulator [Anaerolineae bacterium]